MGYTNKTSHYDLPQWIAGDKPSWLGDMNTAMLNIDTAVAGANASASAAESSAAAANAQVQAQEAKITKNTTNIQALTEQVADVSGVASGALPKNGGTMTGALTLAGAPTQDLQAATKMYVDENSGKGALMLTGGTMTGPLTLSGAPESDLQAATKKYVDDAATKIITLKSTKTFGAPQAKYISAVIMGNIVGLSFCYMVAATDVDAGPTFEVEGNPLNLEANTTYIPTSYTTMVWHNNNISTVSFFAADYDGTKTSIKFTGTQTQGDFIQVAYIGPMVKQ